MVRKRTRRRLFARVAALRALAEQRERERHRYFAENADWTVERGEDIPGLLKVTYRANGYSFYQRVPPEVERTEAVAILRKVVQGDPRGRIVAAMAPERVLR